MTYLLAGQMSELDRLQLQSRVWEPAGARLLADSDVDERLLSAAGEFVAAESLSNVEFVRDDLFDSKLEPGSFDLVHARFQLAPLGRFDTQIGAYLRLLKSGGTLVLEDPDSVSWTFEPAAPAATRLVAWIREAFVQSGGDFDAGRHERGLLANAGLAPRVRAEVVALEPGHPYLRLPLQFAAALRPRLLAVVGESDLDTTLALADDELADPERWGMTFTLVQTWATVG